MAAPGARNEKQLKLLALLKEKDGRSVSIADICDAAGWEFSTARKYLNRGEDLAHVVNTRVAEAEQVEIAGRSMRLAGPEGEERRALQHEPLRVPRRGEPEEQPLVRVAREHEVKVLAPLARQAREACAHRRADILGLRLRHASASRYGRMNA